MKKKIIINSIYENNKSVYLDYASSGIIRKEVKYKINKILHKNLYNPSSSHTLGIKTKGIIENCRFNVSKYLYTLPENIIFTPSGSMSNFIIFKIAIENYKVNKIISSYLEHTSVLSSIKYFSNIYNIPYTLIKNDKLGNIYIDDLINILENEHKKYNILLSLMHGNNEIGNLLNIKKIIKICKKYNILYHSDMAQTLGRYNINVNDIKIDFISSSAHKFNGPMGIGFIYIRDYNKLLNNKYKIMQEYNILGTENIYGIVGLSKALELSYDNLKKEKEKIKKLKLYCIKKLKNNLSNIYFNGLSYDIDKSIYTIINFSIPVNNIFFNIKLNYFGIIISSSSACDNIYSYKSRIIKLINSDKNNINNFINLRVSIGIYTTKEDIDYLLYIIKYIIDK